MVSAFFSLKIFLASYAIKTGAGMVCARLRREKTPGGYFDFFGKNAFPQTPSW